METGLLSVSKDHVMDIAHIYKWSAIQNKEEFNDRCLFSFIPYYTLANSNIFFHWSEGKVFKKKHRGVYVDHYNWVSVGMCVVLIWD